MSWFRKPVAKQDPGNTRVTVVDKTPVSLFFFLLPRSVRRWFVSYCRETPNQSRNESQPRRNTVIKKQEESELSRLAADFEDRQLSLNEATKLLEIRKRAAFDNELIGYFLFLILFIVLILSIFPISLSYDQVDLVRRFFSSENSEEYIDFNTVTTADQIYEFLGTTIAIGLYSFNGTVGNNLKLASLPLIRQKRVKPTNCQIDDVFTVCYKYYRSSDEDKSPFGPANDPERYFHQSGFPILQPSYVFQPDYHINRQDSYGSTAFAVIMPFGQDEAVALVEQLKADEWIDRSTRAVAIDFSFVNGDLGFVTSVEYLFELSPTGRIEDTRRINSYPVLLSENSSATGRIIIYIFFVLGGFYYLAQEFFQFLEAKLAYLRDMWNIFETVNYVVFLVLMSLVALFAAESQSSKDIIDEQIALPVPTDYVDTQTAATSYYLLQSVAGISCMFAFLKVFKFFRLNNRLNLLGRTLSLAFGDLTAYVLIFVVIFISFSFQGYFYYGFEVEAYHNFPGAILSTFQILAGENDYDSIRQASPVLAPLFLLFFIVLIILIMVNMFIAILNEYFEQATKESRKKIEDQKFRFQGETDYDIVERIYAIRPHIKTLKGCKYLSLKSNMPVIIVALGPNDKESDLVKISEKFSEIPILILKSTASSKTSLTNILRDIPIVQFSPSSSEYPYILSLGSVQHPTKKIDEQSRVVNANMPVFDEAFQDNTKRIKEALDELGEYNPYVFTCLEEFNVDQPIYIDFYFSVFKDLTLEWLNWLWDERMSISLNDLQFVDDTVLDRMFSRIKDQHEFVNRTHGMKTESIDTKTFFEYLNEVEKGQVEDSSLNLEESSIEAAVKSFYLSKKVHSDDINLRFDEFARELKIHLSMSDPEASVNISFLELMRETRNVFMSFPQTCLVPLDKETAIRHYNPKSINTSDIDLSRFASMADEMAEYIHDVWTKSKLDDGWRFAPVRDNQQKHHHNMVPYNELKQDDKNYDIKMAEKTIKLILYFGYNIDKITTPGARPQAKMLKFPELQDRLPENYILQLPDLDSVTIPSDLLDLMEILSESAHDEWARDRKKDGWKYGTSGTNPKESDFLLPYFMMTKAQRVNDQNTVMATIKFLYLKGYDIKRPTIASKFEGYKEKLRKLTGSFSLFQSNEQYAQVHQDGSTGGHALASNQEPRNDPVVEV